MKRVAIVQSNYIPWKGYFDMIASVDEFILYDDAQYTRRDWRNRNKIKTPRGLQWLTIPVEAKGKYLQKVRETRVSEPGWPRSHWSALEQNYGRARHFARYRDLFREPLSRPRRGVAQPDKLAFHRGGVRAARDPDEDQLVDGLRPRGRQDRATGRAVPLGRCDTLPLGTGRARLHRPGPVRPGGHRGLVRGLFGLPAYAQLHGDFVHTVTILDLLFNEGPDAPRYMKSVA